MTEERDLTVEREIDPSTPREAERFGEAIWD